jgi:hypothetical protein
MKQFTQLFDAIVDFHCENILISNCKIFLIIIILKYNL